MHYVTEQRFIGSRSTAVRRGLACRDGLRRQVQANSLRRPWKHLRARKNQSGATQSQGPNTALLPTRKARHPAGFFLCSRDARDPESASFSHSQQHGTMTACPSATPHTSPIDLPTIDPTRQRLTIRAGLLRTRTIPSAIEWLTQTGDVSWPFTHLYRAATLSSPFPVTITVMGCGHLLYRAAPLPHGVKP